MLTQECIIRCTNIYHIFSSFQNGFKELFGLNRNYFCCPVSNRGEERTNAGDNYELTRRQNDLDKSCFTQNDQTKVEGSPETVNVDLRSVDSIAVISTNIYVAT
jgi:hypothetical protein